MAGEARVTKAGVYTELQATSGRVTKAGVYVEAGQQQLRVSAIGVYLELEAVPVALDYYAVGIGADVSANLLDRLNPQPALTGVYVTRRNHGINHTLDDEALYLPLRYSAFESAEEYHSVLEQLGIKDTLENEITITARGRDQVWQRWVGTVVQPQLGQDGGWSNYFLRDVVFVVKDLRLAQ